MKRRLPRGRLGRVAVLAVALVGAGCLGVASEAPPEPLESVTRVSATFVERAGGSMIMDPPRVDVPVGATVVWTVTNPETNAFTHDLTFDGLGVTVLPVAPGATEEVRFTVTRDGRFMYWCGQDDGRHHDLGMMGYLYGV